jgi:hypothetical protein
MAAIEAAKAKNKISPPSTSAPATGKTKKSTTSSSATASSVQTTQLGRDFNVFLVRRLTAAKEAQERHELEKKREERRFLKRILHQAASVKDQHQPSIVAQTDDPKLSIYPSMVGKTQNF